MRLAVPALVTVWLLCAVAHAQPAGTDPRQAEAHALFVSGRAAAEQGLWSEAVDRFSRSYGRYPTAAALYNLAVALRALGRHASARDALARLLAEHADELAPEQRSEAQSLLAAESLRAARLTLEGLPRPRVALSLDGEERADSGERPLSLGVDPGDHRLVVSADAFEPYAWEGTLVDGQHLRIEVDLRPRRRAAPPGGEGGSVWSSPWLWIGAGVVVLGAAAVTGYLLLREEPIEPLSDRRYTL